MPSTIPPANEPPLKPEPLSGHGVVTGLAVTLVALVSAADDKDDIEPDDDAVTLDTGETDEEFVTA